MAHLNYRGGSQTVTLETLKEVEPSRPLTSRAENFTTTAESWKRPIKRSHAPQTYSLLRALIKCRRSTTVLLIMFGALVAPTVVFMVTHTPTSTETPPSDENLRGTRSDGGRAPPPQPPLPPPHPQVPLAPVEPRAPPATPHKPNKVEKTVEKDTRPDPPAPPTVVIPNPKPTEVDNEPKRAKPETKVEEETPLECIKSPLWDATVDSSAYEYGCKEIEVSPCSTDCDHCCCVSSFSVGFVLL